MKTFNLVILAPLFIAGCSSSPLFNPGMEPIMAGKVGCPSQEIIILNYQPNVYGVRTFEVACRGQRFICSDTRGVENSLSCASLVKGESETLEARSKNIPPSKNTARNFDEFVEQLNQRYDQLTK